MGRSIRSFPRSTRKTATGFLASVERRDVNKSYFEREFRVVFPDESVRWMAGKGKVFCNGNGDAVRMIGLGMDVTDRRRLEDQLRKSQKLESVGPAGRRHRARFQ